MFNIELIQLVSLWLQNLKPDILKPESMEIIDAYTHCGLSKYEPIEQVARVMASAGVTRAVLVQHLGEFDNSYIGQCVATAPDRLAGVCLVDHTRPDAVSQLEKLAIGWPGLERRKERNPGEPSTGASLRSSPGHPSTQHGELANSGRFRGVRFPVQVLIDAPTLFDAAAKLGLVLVLYAPEGMRDVVEPLDRFLDSHPGATVVLTHLGTPRMEEAPEFPGARSEFCLARHPGVYWQLSGMKMYCPWPHEPLQGLIADAFRAFGPERILWGSNYPVVGSELDYRRDLELLTQGRLPILPAAIPAIAGGNAQRLWFDDSCRSS